MTRPELCVGAIALREARVLLVRRGTEPGRGKWSVPGGRVEAGETIAEAVVRELREETGLVGRCGALIGWVERIGPDHHFVILDFAVSVDDGQPVAGDDADDAQWASRDELDALELVDGLLDFLVEHGVMEARTDVSDQSSSAGASR
ncbi:MAG TPA: NUDIX hydrolase [Acidimicrobiales bacterium]|nr:NUDIX hydrolase [Acidimicrobiales bacterium]